MKRALWNGRLRGPSIVAATAACVIIASSCNENLPSGPNTFSAQLQIVVPHDTIVVGDTNTLQAKATDGAGHLIQALKFGWKSGDTTVLALAAIGTDSDAVNGRTLKVVGRKPGPSVLSLTLPDSRFIVPTATRIEAVVVGGVRVLSSHDSTLTAVNDTGVAISAGLVRVNGALVTRASQGVRWTHFGTHTSIVGQGDTIRYVARSNGVDTLIASHDYCLAGAKCADTVVARVSQQLSLTLSTRNFSAWSLGDSLGPTVTLADRRGNGLAGTTIRFVPMTVADSAIVKVSAAIGVTNPVTGLMAVPRLISAKNGTAKVLVVGVSPDGFAVAVDSVTEVVRQVARHVAVEQLRVTVTYGDSVPMKLVARDARGAPIDDATIDAVPSGIPFNGLWAGPMSPLVTSAVATITPSLTGSSLPQANPAAPQVPVIVDPAQITLIKVDTVTAGATAILVPVETRDSVGNLAAGKWVRFGTSFGAVPDSIQVDAISIVGTVWVPPDSAATYSLTAVRGLPTPMNTLADSMGRILVRRTAVVKADVPSATKTTIGISATTIVNGTTATVTITVKDRFGNKVKTATAADFALTAVSGTFGAVTCSQGVCTVTYTAPGAAGTDSIAVKIGGVDVQFSPLALIIT